MQLFLQIYIHIYDRVHTIWAGGSRYGTGRPRRGTVGWSEVSISVQARYPSTGVHSISFCSKGPTLPNYGPLYCKTYCISSAILFLLTFGHSSYPEALQVSRYLNEQRQDEEEHSFHSHVCYDDPYARPLKGKNVVHKAKCTGGQITKPVEWTGEYSIVWLQACTYIAWWWCVSKEQVFVYIADLPHGLCACCAYILRDLVDVDVIETNSQSEDRTEQGKRLNMLNW